MLVEILASMLGYVQPSLPTPKYYNTPPPIILTVSDCSKPDKIKSMLPKYGIENRVAEFNTYSDFNDQIGDFIVRASTEYFLYAYNSKLRSSKTANLTNLEKIKQFLEGDNFDIIELYEMNNLHQLHNKPSAIIYKNIGITYVIYDLKGPMNLADSNFDAVECKDYWHPNLVLETGSNILIKRVQDKMEKDGLPLPLKKSNDILI